MALAIDSERRPSVVVSGTDQGTPQALRDAVIDAALRVIQERGLARTRTSHIARAAGCSEGSIYRYFSGKSELVHEVIRSRLLTMIGTLGELPTRAGTATVEANVFDAARAALASYGDGVMLLGGLFADAELLAAEREFLAGRDAGPHAVAVNLAAYLKAEQRLGRVRAEADVDVAARVVLASCLGESFFRAIDAAVDAADQERYLRGLVETVVGSLVTSPPDDGSDEPAPRPRE
ncbi:MAG: TetR/AcrR family transcriptional regulator [Solirubrobacteraceae bacterium]